MENHLPLFLEKVKNEKYTIKDGVIFKNGKELKSYSRWGYRRISMKVNEKRITIFQHRLLYAYYHNLTELDHNLVINHINGNKEDNRKENLELVTVTENNRHALNKLGKDRTPNRKLTDEQVLVIRKELSKGVKQVELSKRFGVTRTTISYISKNKCWKSEVLV